MTVDNLFLENIDEAISDENKIVTFKWLSQTLQVNCNTAKQMLYQYIQTERNEKSKDGLTVTYFLSGLAKPDTHGQQAFKCAVVPEEKLAAYKTTYDVLTSCHIYSVQKCTLKDSNALYMTDYEKFKDDVFGSNKYSSIQCERAELRSQEDMEMLTLNTVPVVQPDKKPPQANTSSKPAQKSMPKSAIANMFAKTDAKKTGKDAGGKAKKDVKEEIKVEPKTDPKANILKATAGKKGAKKGGMEAFFSKQTAKKTPEVSNAKSSTDKNTTASKDTVSTSKPVDKTTTVSKSKHVDMTTPEDKKKSPKKPTSKKTPRQRDSDDEEDVKRVKRRRTKQDIFESSSEEEEMEADPESPIPPTPPREKTPPPKADSPEVEEIEDPIPNKSSKEASGKGDNKSGENRRVRRRKHVNKTYMGDDGFMVTEKVWESESASEAEEPVKKEAKKTAPAKSPAKGKKSPPKKPSPGKKGSGKQASLFSFFKKS